MAQRMRRIGKKKIAMGIKAIAAGIIKGVKKTAKMKTPMMKRAANIIKAITANGSRSGSNMSTSFLARAGQ
jgi:hypothetical protein